MTLYKYFLLVICLVPLGCQSQVALNANPVAKQSMQDMKDARDKCGEAFNSGVLKSYVKRAECINNKATSISNKYSIPYKDITVITNAYRSALAARLDSSEITEKEAAMIMGGAGYVLDAEEDNRRSAKGAYPKERWRSKVELVQELNSQPNTILGDNKIICVSDSELITCK